VFTAMSRETEGRMDATKVDEAIEGELKTLIVESLGLSDVTPERIDATAPLFGPGSGGLGLDSIDALELAMAINKRWGVKTRSDDAENKAIFSSVRALATFVTERRRAAS
jgi:acyl carrier protein